MGERALRLQNLIRGLTEPSEQKIVPIDTHYLSSTSIDME